MSDAKILSKADPNGRFWDEDLIYHVLNHKFRRSLLLCLARGGPRPASQLGGIKLGSTIKQLVEMIEAGLVVKSPNPKDGRQPIYGLVPAVPVVKTETGVVIDFGFCVVRL
ncbi:MAG: hypothetical protein JWM68_2613 [Verrucomicrobiales bacterium]|nr:hypothetical protein [Verrucomicrobiales bacterium]